MFALLKFLLIANKKQNFCRSAIENYSAMKELIGEKSVITIMGDLIDD